MKSQLIKGDAIKIDGTDYIYLSRIDAEEVKVGNSETHKIERKNLALHTGEKYKGIICFKKIES